MKICVLFKSCASNSRARKTRRNCLSKSKQFREFPAKSANEKSRVELTSDLYCILLTSNIHLKSDMSCLTMTFRTYTRSFQINSNFYILTNFFLFSRVGVAFMTIMLSRIIGCYRVLKTAFSRLVTPDRCKMLV